METGKRICQALKELRKRIADANDIQFEIEECTHKGDCPGTCPKCEGELQYLMDSLRKREEDGKPITYDDICKKPFCNNKIYWAYKDGIDSDMASPSNYKDVDNCTSEAQVKRLIAFNKLQNIAKYLNDGWKPLLNKNTQNWFISESQIRGYRALYTYSNNHGRIFFKSEYLANEAIRLMGNDSLSDLFSTNW